MNSISLIRRSLAAALGAFVLLLSAHAAEDAKPRPGGGERGEWGGRQERGERRGDKLAEMLGLSEDQKSKMQAIGQQERDEMKILRSDSALSKEDRQSKMREIHEKYRTQRDAILTPEQRTKAEQLRGKMRDRMEDRQERREKKAE